jgi:pimeloyl-ACP methyl ester carboxylesterase
MVAAAEVEGTRIHWEGEGDEPVLLVSGPPASGLLFRGVQARLGPLRTGAVDLVAGPAVHEIESLVDRLAAVCVETGARALVAHGLAVPLALHLPAAAVPRVIVSNGPLQGLHPIMRALTGLPEPLWERLLLRPGFAGRWLSSSAALRRAVVNPYVMDRATVDALLAELVDDPHARASTACWATQLGRLLPVRPAAGACLDAVWGDRDRLHPVAGIEGMFQAYAERRLIHIPGGQWLHPEERPWALADAVSELLAVQTTT